MRPMPRSISVPIIAACWWRDVAPMRRRQRPFRVVDAFSRIVRLGEGLAASGVLSEAAMARTLDALKVCADKIAEHRVAGARSIATEACRRATNCAEFMARVASETGIALEIITAQEEARLVVAGCAPLLDPRIPYALVFDIGGGSTELVWLSVDGGDAADHRFAIAAAWRRHLERSLWRARGVGDDLRRDGRRDRRRAARYRAAPGHRLAHRRGSRCRCSAPPAR